MSITRKTIQTYAPGTLFLMGEHAVLHGYPAITAAVDQGIQVSLRVNDSLEVNIQSALGDYAAPLHDLKRDPALSFVLATIEAYSDRLEQGLDIEITSAISATVGLGSSAAVTVALAGALQYLLDGETELQQVFQTALLIMRQVQQGRGSGADLAACVYGGLVAYEKAPVLITPLQGLPDIQLFYCGYKMKTPDVIARVEQLAARFPAIYQQLYRQMGEITRLAVDAANVKNWQQFGHLMNLYQGLMDALGVNDKNLAAMVYQLREQGALGAKISGSGLGDCVYALSPEAALQLDGFEQLPVSLSRQGLQVDVTEAAR